MATKFIILTQVHRPKIPISTRKPPRCNRSKPRPSNSISENIFYGKTLVDICHNNLDSHPLIDSLLFMEDESVKEKETSQDGKVSNCNRKDGKPINMMKYGDLRREVVRLSLLWYMKGSISYILRKARAFYNEFCCDTNVESSTMVVVDPYFSIPVLPFGH